MKYDSQELEKFSEPLRLHGFKSTLNWYKIRTSGVGPQDERSAFDALSNKLT
jgi:hypothetical protein